MSPEWMVALYRFNCKSHILTWLGDLMNNGKGTGPSDDEGQSSSARSERLSWNPLPWTITPPPPPLPYQLTLTWLGDLMKNGKGTGPSDDEGQSSSARSERLSRNPPPWSITPSDRNLHSHHWSYRDDHLKYRQEKSRSTGSFYQGVQ